MTYTGSVMINPIFTPISADSSASGITVIVRDRTNVQAPDEANDARTIGLIRVDYLVHRASSL